MKFKLSDLVRARFPDPLAAGREIILPIGVRGKIKRTDGILFSLRKKQCINLQFWLLYDELVIPADQVVVDFEPGSDDSVVVPLNDSVIERFHAGSDLSDAGLRQALAQPDDPRPPSRMLSPEGCELFQAYFQRHEPYCHLLLQAQPDLAWRAYFYGAVPTEFQGFKEDYQHAQLSKMAAHHAAIDPQHYDRYADFLASQIPPPTNPYLWMADYARRKGLADAVGFIDSPPIAAGLLTLPRAAGPSAPRYPPKVMSLLLANPARQLTALVLFALTEGSSTAWPKPPGFDRWLYAAFAER
jgi:hypothetical protein